MSTAEIRKALHEAIDIADETRLHELKEFVIPGSIEDDWYDTLSTEQKKEVDEAIKELDEGKGIPHGEVMKKYKGKYFQ